MAILSEEMMREFPALAQQYDIFYVPKTVINETREFIGENSESEFLEHVVQAGH